MMPPVPRKETMATLTHSARGVTPTVPAAPLPEARSLRARFARAGTAVWKALEDFGYARARRDLAQIAQRYEQSSPELARQLRQLDR